MEKYLKYKRKYLLAKELYGGASSSSAPPAHDGKDIESLTLDETVMELEAASNLPNDDRKIFLIDALEQRLALICNELPLEQLNTTYTIIISKMRPGSRWINYARQIKESRLSDPFHETREERKGK